MARRNGGANGLLRSLPSVEALAQRPALRGFPHATVTRMVRAFLDEVRERVRSGEASPKDLQVLFEGGGAEDELTLRCQREVTRHHRRIVNATGVVLHTGLGRAPLAAAAREAVVDAAGYSIVEVDPHTGERNEREVAVAGLLCGLTGAGGALVVNNNAAATTLALAATAAGSEVVISRGQLVEIGGGFRMPDVMAQAGCRMVEVGTTNRTHLRDFAVAIGPECAALLLVHPSNFRVVGFTAMPSREELVTLARGRGVAVIDDLGSGLLVKDPLPAVPDEPRVIDVLQSGVDLVCFSGDKLLGGPQCGILLGEADRVAEVRRHPLYRAFRCDKLTLAALEATLRVYRDGDPLRDIPTLRMLAAEPEALRARAETLAKAIGGDVSVIASEAFAGSGANPARPLPSWSVALPGGDELLARLREPRGGPPVFARIDQRRVLLDLRTLELEDLDEVAALIRARR